MPGRDPFRKDHIRRSRCWLQQTIFIPRSFANLCDSPFFRRKLRQRFWKAGSPWAESRSCLRWLGEGTDLCSITYESTDSVTLPHGKLVRILIFCLFGPRRRKTLVNDPV